MKNKVTAKDVAKEAGVSVATVSYVMNGRTDQKISEETKRKILQIANLLNYVPSHAAKSLATGRNNAIGISYFLTEESPTRNAKILAFSNILIERFHRMKYDVTLIPAHKTEEGLPINRNIDAIVAIDLTHDDFRSLADNYLVPVICVDMLVNDTLFYQIYEDMPFLIEKALMEYKQDEKVYYIYDSRQNAAFEDFMLSLPANVFPVRKRELTPSVLENMRNSNVIIDGAFLALTVSKALDKAVVITSESEKALIPPTYKYLINNDIKKANVTMNIVMNAIDRNFDVTHDHKIR